MGKASVVSQGKYEGRLCINQSCKVPHEFEERLFLFESLFHLLMVVDKNGSYNSNDKKAKKEKGGEENN